MSAALDRDRAVAEITVTGPAARSAPASTACVYAAGVAFWSLAVARELDDHPRPADQRDRDRHLGLPDRAATRLHGSAHDGLLLANYDSDWLARNCVLYWKRTLKRLDVTSRSLIALIEPGSCFAGSLLEFALAADRSYMLFGVFEDIDREDFQAPGRPCPGRCHGRPGESGPLPMGNGLTRLATRFLGDADGLAAVEKALGAPLEAEAASSSAWSPSPRTTSTGTRKCASRSRSAPRSPLTR